MLDAAERDEVLADYEGAAIVDNLRTLRPAPAEDATIEPNGSRMFYIQLTFDRPRDVPDAVVHHLDLQAPPTRGLTSPLRSATPSAASTCTGRCRWSPRR